MTQATTRVAVTGAAGKMGRTLIKALTESHNLALTAAIEQPGASTIGTDAGELVGIGKLGILTVDNIETVINEFDVLIDFTIAAATVKNIEICAANQRNMIIGTTGLSLSERDRLSELSASMAVVMATNFSVGVNATFKLLEVAAEIFADDVDIEIIETHHNQKVDAPSGTALTMGESITDKTPSQQIAYHSLRIGDVVGEHTVIFAGSGERVEITHRAQSRDNFAQGALRAAGWIADKKSGLFDMRDVLGLNTIK